MPLLELKSVSVGYGRNPVLQDVDLTLERGEIVTLLGANGAGKSTLAKSISGLLGTGTGTILRMASRSRLWLRPSACAAA
jgi:branched-chain amino acid transport system ATP-binding protein